MEGLQPDSSEEIAGRYRVLSLLGRGGMAYVYRVADQQLCREIALKRLLAPRGQEQAAVELFEREFHTLSELAHPRIIEVYDYGVDADGAYYTMELLQGRDLRELGKTDWRTVCALLRDVASSLAILHSRRLLHCDVSPRNVRCTLDGRAKLLDFGAMTTMGVTRRIVGTPPFVAPEMVHLQTLDGRADLYGLGALGYWLLTGRYAYPARTIAQLRDLWQTSPRPPIELEASVPAALSELVMDCMRLNRNARPRSAGVVMERLCAIASLPLDEQSDVARAYLTTPVLVGRDQQLVRVRRDLLATRGTGSVLAVQGPSGSGRSRLLDACMLEAKLLGWQVLRTGSGDAAQGSYGVARSLCEQLYELAPKEARTAARLHAPVLAHVLGAELVQSEPAAELPARKDVLLSLRDFVLSVGRSLRLCIAVDDADHIDEPSASLLIALGHKAQRRPLCLIVAMDSEGNGSAALDLLLDTAVRVDLPPLSVEQTETLVKSLFGAANHTLTLARRLHEVTLGNPRAVMQLAEHLVDQGIVRYEAGSFLLPEHLSEQHLPRSLAVALEHRTTLLDADALELGRVLALTDPRELPTSRLAELTGHADRARTHRALDQLLRAQVLEVEGDRYRLSHAVWRGVLCSKLEEPVRLELHARLARVFEPAGTVARRAHHLMESAQPEAAIRVLLAQYLKDPNEPRDPLEDYVPGMLALLERAAVAGDALRLPAPLLAELRMKTAGASQFLGDIECFMRVAPPLLQQLERESGLLDYRAQDPNMEPMARLTAALGQTQQRYDATPVAERGLPPIDAIREVSRLCSMFAAAGTISLDVGFFDRLPSLSPIAVLSPAIAVIQMWVDAMRALTEGRSARAQKLINEVVQRLDQPDRAGLGVLYHKSIRLSAFYIIGLIEASSGIPDAGKRVAELEREPGHRVNAQRTHLACHLMQGDVDEAAAAQRRAELVMLQDGQQQRYPGTTARVELQVHALMGDLDGVKQVTERLAKAAIRYPRWSVLVQLGRCHHRRLQGDFAGALEALQVALDLAKPGRDRDWSSVAAAHVQVSTELGHPQEAADLGINYMQICEREELHPGSRWVAQATGDALLAAGRAAEAVVIAENLIAEVTQAGGRGLALGAVYELRARAAIAEGDGVAFQECATRCAAEYRPDRNPGVSAKYERLLRDAEAAGILVSRQTLRPPSAAADITSSAGISSTIQSRMLECPDAAMRARCALSILAEAVRSEQAYLYGMSAGRTVFLCAVPEAPRSEALDLAVQRHLNEELRGQVETVTATEGNVLEHLGRHDAQVTVGTQSTALLSDAHGVAYPVVLSSKREGQPVIAAIAALYYRDGLRTMPSASLLEGLASALLEYDDVDPVTCLV